MVVVTCPFWSHYAGAWGTFPRLFLISIILVTCLFWAYHEGATFCPLISSSLSRVYCKRTTQVKLFRSSSNLCKAFLYVCSGKGLADKVKGFFNIQEKVAYFSHRTIKIPNLGYKKTCLGTHCSLNSVCSLPRKKSDLCTFEVIKFISVLKITRFL